MKSYVKACGSYVILTNCVQIKDDLYKGEVFRVSPSSNHVTFDDIVTFDIKESIEVPLENKIMYAIKYYNLIYRDERFIEKHEREQREKSIQETFINSEMNL